jgi:hypothetical protein
VIADPQAARSRDWWIGRLAGLTEARNWFSAGHDVFDAAEEVDRQIREATREITRLTPNEEGKPS